MELKEIIRKYKDKFSEGKLWTTLGKAARQIGLKSVYSVLLLFYAYRRKETPVWAKNIVLGTLGYLLTPFDMLPDLTPLIGYTDDIGILSFGLVTIAAYVNNEVRVQARKKLSTWFGTYNEEDLAEVDARL